EQMISSTEKFGILDESYLDSGVAGYILNRISGKYLAKFTKTFALPPEVIPHGERDEILKSYRLSPELLAEEILKLFYD
ncbi:MAG TPA: 1-deoxy-D-xylulose-5-phosphate synthase, partial [Leptospiraceae bacterium]|nr:1-deoxy-D-xylulose-5-phosphate synthase [Leptospiraceae bacterium]HNN03600.1 1-deoxy-D-xylulose-5-phosphate synthase [Leptospiraceae bacterium]